MSSENTTGTISVEWSLIEATLDLPERIELFRRRSDAFEPDHARARSVLERWRSLIGRSSEESMDDRLGDLGITKDELAEVVGRIDESAAGDVPSSEWMTVLEEVLSWDGPCDEDGVPQSEALGHDANRDPIPFEDGLVPWVDVATARLRGLVPNLDEHLRPEVLRVQQLRLLENLSNFARFACIADLDDRRLSLYDGNDLALGMLIADPPRIAYRRTIRDMVGTNSHGWMSRYPAAARLLAVRVVAWARCLAEFLDRLEADRAILEETYGDGAAIGALSMLKFGSGDSHNGGRSVAICGFESGHRVVYKPRSCAVDIAFTHIVEAANAMLPVECRLRVPITIDRGRWGWAEFLESSPGADLEDLRRYQRRMGVLLALIHMLQGNDFHLENVMAVGEHPVAIDLETVCVPESPSSQDERDEDPVQRKVLHSVLRTLLLPSVMGFRGGLNIQNLGAVRVEVEQGNRRRIQRLDRVNTDFQRWVAAEPTDERRPESEAWIESGEVLSTEEQLALTQEGYRVAYQAFLACRKDWLGEESPIRLLEGAYVRVLHRATNIYVRLIQQSCQVENLRTGVDRWLAVDRASLSVTSDADDRHRKSHSAVVRAESVAVRDGDVAYFVSPGSGTSYWSIDPESTAPVEVPGTFLRRSAVDAARDQVRRMGEDDLALQTTLQSDAYRTALVTLERSIHERGRSPAVAADAKVRSRPLQELVVDLLDHIIDRGIAHPEGVNWIDLQLDVAAEVARPAAMTTDIYSGRGGLALLFERAYRILGDRRYLDAAANCLRLEHHHWMTTPGFRHELTRARPDGVGNRNGLMAGWWAVGRHEGYGELRDAAGELATALSDRAVQGDDGYDVIAGSAGSILLLVRMSQEESVPGVNDVVGRLADHLVRAGNQRDGWGWRIPSQRLPLCGFGHGRAGIGLALMEAGRALDRSELRRIAEEVFEVEHRHRGSVPSQGWPDYRGLGAAETPKARMGSPFWCSGTEGVALSRAAALQISDAPVLEDDLQFALETVRNPPVGRGHLCCGVSGRLLARNTLARLSAESPLPASETEQTISTLLQQALDGSDCPVLGLGLFQGMAGLAWTGLSTLEDDGSDLMLLRP